MVEERGEVSLTGVERFADENVDECWVLESREDLEMSTKVLQDGLKEFSEANLPELPEFDSVDTYELDLPAEERLDVSFYLVNCGDMEMGIQRLTHSLDDWGKVSLDSLGKMLHPVSMKVDVARYRLGREDANEGEDEGDGGEELGENGDAEQPRLANYLLDLVG